MTIEEIYELMKKNIETSRGITIRAMCYDDNGEKKLGFDTVSVDFTKDDETFSKIKNLSEDDSFIAWIDDTDFTKIVDKYKIDNDVDFVNDSLELQQDKEFVINKKINKGE